MKPSIRRIGDPIPVSLLIQPDGTLVLADGSDVKTYLAEVHLVNTSLGHATTGEALAVVLSPRKLQERIEQDAWLHQHHSS